MKKYIILCFLALFLYDESIAQDDLLSLLGEEETIDFATASFKANRVINLHSIEN
ncbi:MAG: hypothetical protein HKN51_00055, partial [Saprospiraceae bacterium]|nr:hypothetical protein [Saprospiraceae bacterium]